MLHTSKKTPSPEWVANELRAAAVAQGGVLAPRRNMEEAGQVWRCKIPAVVMRTDGRYGVAAPARGASPRDCVVGQEIWHRAWRGDISARVADRILGRMSFDTTGTSGYRHLPETFGSRDEAEKRAWALARELAATEDWP